MYTKFHDSSDCFPIVSDCRKDQYRKPVLYRFGFFFNADYNPPPLAIDEMTQSEKSCHDASCTHYDKQPIGPFEGCVPLWRVAVGLFGIVFGLILLLVGKSERRANCGGIIFFLAVIIWASGHKSREEQDCGEEQKGKIGSQFHGNTVPLKYLLTSHNYWGTVIGIGDTQMANVLPREKQIAVISALAEVSGIRQIERMTGINRMAEAAA